MPGARQPIGPKRRPASAAKQRSQRKNTPSKPQQRDIDFASLFESAPDAIIIMDEEGRYTHANNAACHLTGYTEKELTAMRVGDLTVPSDRFSALERFRRLRRAERVEGDFLIRRKDGSEIWVEVHAVPSGNGTYQMILRDVSERLTAQEGLKRSNEAYSTLLDLCHAAVLSCGPDGLLRSWNRAAETLFGYSEEEAIGMHATKLIPARSRSAHEAAFGRRVASTTEEPFGRTLRVHGLRKDRTEVPLEVSVGVGNVGPDRVFTAVIRDITEHHTIVERLNDAVQRLQFHIERMPLAYIVWDLDLKVVEWNPAAEHIFGYTKAEAVGRNAYKLIVPPEAVEAVGKVWANLLKGDNSSHSINANIRKDGSRMTCEWLNTPLRDSTGNIRGVASMARDVTEREAIEARIRDAQKLESLGVMAGGIAHDFNSSLMVILGNAALLRSIKGLPLRVAEHIELIEEAGSRANNLIKHLLAYARTGRHNPQPTDLNAVIQDTLSFVRSSLGKSCELELKLAKQLDPILADRSQLEQIILNLCLNAKQAMPKGGTIEIVTRRTTLTAAQTARCVPYDIRPGDYVEMVVSDKGCGMDEATRSRIFDPFFTTKPEGHGLGLAAVLGILRQHQAAAWVESQVGKGTKMHIYFPVKHSA